MGESQTVINYLTKIIDSFDQNNVRVSIWLIS